MLRAAAYSQGVVTKAFVNAEETITRVVGKRTDDKKTRAEKRFKKLDKNGDSSLSLDEYKAGEKKS